MMKTKAFFSKEGLQQAALAKDEDPNTETKKWYGYTASRVTQSSSSSSAAAAAAAAAAALSR